MYPSDWIINRLKEMPSIGSFDNTPYNVVDGYFVGGVLNTSVSTSTFAALSFALSSVIDASGYTTVFDQYRIRCVEVTLLGQTQDNVANNVGHNWTVVDYDDATPLTSINQALSYPNCIISNAIGPGSVVVRSFEPHTASAVYGGSVFTSFGNDTGKWIDAGSPSAQYYGLKICADQTTAVTTYDVSVRMWLQFRNPR